jgi:transposase
MLCDVNGTPLRFLLSGGQASDISHAQPLLDEVSIPSNQRGRTRKRCKWLLADKGYAAMVSLPCSMRCLRHLFSYRT